ncbi:cysteine hydrolase family protein [Stackebrandtia albiflava]
MIDMQNALMDIAHRARDTIAAVAALRERATAAGALVVTVQHRGPGLEPGTDGWRVTDALTPAPGEPVVHKTAADSFLDTDLDEVLRAAGVTEVVVTGFATEQCVESTARQALSRRYDLVWVTGGHTTSLRSPGDGFAPAAQALAHHDAIYRGIEFPGRRIRVLSVDEVDFTG